MAINRVSGVSGSGLSGTPVLRQIVCSDKGIYIYIYIYLNIGIYSGRDALSLNCCLYSNYKRYSRSIPDYRS